jgi:hypothetical protein
MTLETKDQKTAMEKKSPGEINDWCYGCEFTSNNPGI